MYMLLRGKFQTLNYKERKKKERFKFIDHHSTELFLKKSRAIHFVAGLGSLNDLSQLVFNR